VELTEAQLKSFIELYEQEFGIVLTKVEAQYQASRLLGYVLVCARPLAKAHANDINNMPNES
jgi:hypothetical protein